MTTRTEIIAQIDAEIGRLQRARDFLAAALAGSKNDSKTRTAIALASKATTKAATPKRKQPATKAAPVTKVLQEKAIVVAIAAPPPPAKEEPQVKRVPPRRRMERRHLQTDRAGKSGAALSGQVPTGPVVVSPNEPRKVQERAVPAPLPPIVSEPRPEIGAERSLGSLIQAFDRRAGLSGLENPSPKGLCEPAARMEKSRSPLYVTTLIAGAFFMENLDGTIIATALPQMAHSLHTSAVSLNIGMTAYLLTLAVFIPISGWVADRFGSRSIFAAAIATFTIASLLCGAAHTLTEFTLMRILQGMGGAMMVPVGRLIVLRTTPKDKLTLALAYITWPGLTALVVGPPLGGLLPTYARWHWIFFLNLPLGIIALILTLLWVENVRSGEMHAFDWRTFLLAGFASAGAVYGMEKLGSEGGP